MIVGELIARNTVYMHHNNNVGLTLAIQFGGRGARPTDLNFGGGGGDGPPCPLCSASPVHDTIQQDSETALNNTVICSNLLC